MPGEYDDIFSRRMQSMRRDLSKLLEKDPEPFQRVIEEYVRLGSSVLSGAAKRSNSIPNEAHAFLFARYKIRGKQTKEQFVQLAAKRGWVSEDRYSTVRWGSEPSIDAALKTARVAYKSDELFRKRVDFIIWCFEIPRENG